MSESAVSSPVYANYGDFSFLDIEEENAKAGKTEKRLGILKVIVIALSILLVVEAIFYALIMPCLGEAKVECYGLKNISREEVLDAVSSADSSIWLHFNTGAAVDALSYIPGIETFSVEKAFPDRVIINVTERESVAKTIVNVNGRSKTVQIDKNGVLFSTAASADDHSGSIPLVTGLPLELKEGTRLPSKYRSLMERIAEIESLPQNYFAAISEIQIVPKDYGNYELVLYPVQSYVRVLTDSALSKEALEYMCVTLDVINLIELDVSELDLRYGAVSYRVN